ncbi:MAG: epoxyqueuosine reductase QueH [Lachnospiraceae bacterium]|nr:epoxyqueuosine reductase QueH [Lachnospiraceae bacterium]
MKEYKEYSNVNFQKELEKELAVIVREGRIPTLLLHSCCAPCSSYCLTYLADYFQITVDYYNPNIYPPEEYQMRVAEQQRLIAELPVKYPVSFVEGAYEPEVFFAAAKGLEQVREGGERCFRCYELRLREAAIRAKEGGFDYFTTTLSISPLKNAAKLNEIGGRLAKEYGVEYLYSDFKKKNGYKRSVELSQEYGLYRQDYCGCVFSKRERAEEA